MDWVVEPDELAFRWETADTTLHPLRLGTTVPVGGHRRDWPDDPEFAAALDVLGAPELRITAEGDHPDALHTIRLLGCVVGEVAALAAQTSSVMPNHVGPVRIWYGPRTALDDRIAVALPAGASRRSDTLIPPRR
ncbi:hypothetical protein D7D52_31825 [Nocardia yunnanensis]|uniref:Uncharacterized protein n=1 Tax=Nocardia yunnanensis TaxID=2382165 RepID=A0A386ZK41_9NOCA|nr:hypothetical protein [Nocardia yunnanensis]AYF77643.1 hypothetical protein D7D52_31825 [Nocardia yunnanensis]